VRPPWSDRDFFDNLFHCFCKLRFATELNRKSVSSVRLLPVENCVTMAPKVISFWGQNDFFLGRAHMHPPQPHLIPSTPTAPRRLLTFRHIMTFIFCAL